MSAWWMTPQDPNYWDGVMNTTPTKDNIIGIRTEMQPKSLVQCDDDDAD